MRCLLVLLLLVSDLFPAAASAAPLLITPDSSPEFAALSVRRFDASSGLAPGTVNDLALDADGLMWAASTLGAFSYDGLRWTLLEGSRELGPVMRITVDGPHVWIGAVRALARFDGKTLERIELPGPLGLGRVEQGVQALAAHAGTMYVGVDGGLYRCEGTRCGEVAAAAGIRVATLRWHAGALYIGTAYEGLFVLDPDAAVLQRAVIGSDVLLPNAAVRSLLPHAGALLIGTGRGVTVADPEAPRSYNFKDGRTIVMSLAVAAPAAPDAPVWAALTERGLGRIDGASWRVYSVHDGLPADRFLALAFDPAGQLWAAGESGVLRLDAHAVSAFDERHGLPQQSIAGLGLTHYPDSAEPAPWVGTRGGSVRWVRGRWRALPEPLGELIINDVVAVGSSLYISAEEGIFRWDASGIRVVDLSTQNFPASYASALGFDAAGERLWVGTGHGAGRLTGERFTRLKLPVRDSGGPGVRAFLPGRDGSFWMLHREGLVQLRGDGIVDDWRPCPDAQFWNAALELSPERWLLANDTGVFLARRSDSSCVRWPLPTLPDVATERIVRIGAHELAVLRSDGLARVSLEGERATAAWLLTPADGLPSTQFRGKPFLDPRGRLWMGTAAGLAVYDTTRPRPEASAQLRWTAVSAGMNAFTEGASLPPERATLHFAYRLPSLVREHAIRYCRQLEGVPQEEICDGAQSVEYSRLPAGLYRFQVKAFDGFGRPAGTLSMRFSVLPEWWLRPGFLAFAGLLLVLAGVLGGRLRSQRHARRARELEHLVASRTVELADANAQLAEAAYHDPLTGVGNRRDFIKRALPSLREAGRPFVLMLVDGDRFKAVNDTHGHHAGDAVLIAIAERLASLAPQPPGGVYRWGGEEFLLAVPVKDRHAAAALAERALAVIRDTPIGFDAQTITVTVSIGWVLVLPGSELERIDQSIARADRAVYQAKHEGRDRAVAWSG